MFSGQQSLFAVVEMGLNRRIDHYQVNLFGKQFVKSTDSFDVRILGTCQIFAAFSNDL